jgi:hypothetical protein
LHQFSQSQQGVKGNGGNGRFVWGGCGGQVFGRVGRRCGPGLGDADGSYLGVVDDVAGWLAASGFEAAFDNGRLPCQGMIWMYNPHNLRIFYRYRGFI